MSANDYTFATLSYLSFIVFDVRASLLSCDSVTGLASLKYVLLTIRELPWNVYLVIYSKAYKVYTAMSRNFICKDNK